MLRRDHCFHSRRDWLIKNNNFMHLSCIIALFLWHLRTSFTIQAFFLSDNRWICTVAVIAGGRLGLCNYIPETSGCAWSLKDIAVVTRNVFRPMSEWIHEGRVWCFGDAFFMIKPVFGTFSALLHWMFHRLFPVGRRCTQLSQGWFSQSWKELSLFISVERKSFRFFTLQRLTLDTHSAFKLNFLLKLRCWCRQPVAFHVGIHRLLSTEVVHFTFDWFSCQAFRVIVHWRCMNTWIIAQFPGGHPLCWFTCSEGISANQSLRQVVPSHTCCFFIQIHSHV